MAEWSIWFILGPLTLAPWCIMLCQQMPSPEPSRIFISYARSDGAILAQRLQSDLTKAGFDTWLDTQGIAGGATWTKKIEHALDEAECVLALMTSGSYVSEICRAEQLRALRKGKCVIPLMAQRGADVPLHLEAKNYRDFTADSRYAQSFTEVLADLHRRNGISLKREFQQTYVVQPIHADLNGPEEIRMSVIRELRLDFFQICVAEMIENIRPDPFLQLAQSLA